MERKLYGSSETPSFAAILPEAGDPDFETDAQNNDNAYVYDTDVRDSVRDS